MCPDRAKAWKGCAKSAGPRSLGQGLGQGVWAKAWAKGSGPRTGPRRAAGTMMTRRNPTVRVQRWFGCTKAPEWWDRRSICHLMVLFSHWFIFTVIFSDFHSDFSGFSQWFFHTGFSDFHIDFSVIFHNDFRIFTDFFTVISWDLQILRPAKSWDPQILRSLKSWDPETLKSWDPQICNPAK